MASRRSAKPDLRRPAIDASTRAWRRKWIPKIMMVPRPESVKGQISGGQNYSFPEEENSHTRDNGSVSHLEWGFG